MASTSTTRHPRRGGRVTRVLLDLGSSGLRMAYSIAGDKVCTEIGNYPGAQAGTPSLVLQAPSNIIYLNRVGELGKAIRFGYGRARLDQEQISVSKVKIALLPNPDIYGYAYSLLADASYKLGLASAQQIAEDFLTFAVAHAIKECGGPPEKGWVCSVPQSYGIPEVQNYRRIMQNAGAVGNVDIYGESDCVTIANMEYIEDLFHDSMEAAFKHNQSFSVAAAILDLGAGTSDVTASRMRCPADGSPPTMEEMRAPLGFAIGGYLFDERFVDLLRVKLGNNGTLDQEQTFLQPFIDHFRMQSKPRWPDDFEEETYPLYVGEGRRPFVLTLADMAHIMTPPIEETCRRIGQHLRGLKLQLVVVSGGNSEVPGMMPRLRKMLKEEDIISTDEQVIHGQTSNAVIRGLDKWARHDRLVRGKYARQTLARVILREREELPADLPIPKADAQVPDFYNCAQRVMTEGDLVPDGTWVDHIYFEIDATETHFKVAPIIICIPNQDSQEHTSSTYLWNFASECRPVGVLDLVATLADIKVSALKRSKRGKREFWLLLKTAVGVGLTFTIYWKPDGRRVEQETDKGLRSARLTLDLQLPDKILVNEFRTPIQPRQSSNSTISNDTLPQHLQTLKDTEILRLSHSTHPPQPPFYQIGYRGADVQPAYPTQADNQGLQVDFRWANKTHLGVPPSPLANNLPLIDSGTSRRKRSFSETSTGQDDAFRMKQRVHTSPYRQTGYHPENQKGGTSSRLPSPHFPLPHISTVQYAGPLPTHPSRLSPQIDGVLDSKIPGNMPARGAAHFQTDPNNFQPPHMQLTYPIYDTLQGRHPVSWSGSNQQTTSVDPQYLTMGYQQFNNPGPHRQVAHPSNQGTIQQAASGFQGTPATTGDDLFGGNGWPVNQ